MKSILDNFEKGRVILLNELIEAGLTKGDIDKLVENKDLCECTEYEGYTGIYYINNPIESCGVVFNTVISAYEVVEALYIGRSNELGFIYGVTALNRFGACDQVPVVTEICTIAVNEDKEIVVGNQRFVLYAYKTRYTFEYNFKSIGICVIDILFNKYYGWFDSNPFEVFDNIVKNFNINRDDLNVLSNKSDFLVNLLSEYNF